MPFELCNMPATFQCLMELVLSGLHWTSCLVYLDDIIVFSKTVNKHRRELEEVLDHLRGAGLKAKPNNCQLLRRNVVSKKGIQVDFEKVRVVAQWPVPSCQQEIKSSLDLHLIIESSFPTLHRLLPICIACDRAFGSLKQLLTSAPILIFPHFDHPFILDVDVSAVQSQVIDGHECSSSSICQSCPY